MSTITHSQRYSARGQSLVELALLLPLIMLLVAGAVAFGMAMSSKVALQDAAQEGALYGSFNPTDSAGMVARVRGSSTSPIDLTNTTLVTVSTSLTGSACRNTGGTPNAVQVTVSYNFPIFTPYVAAIIGGSTIPLIATATDTILTPGC